MKFNMLALSSLFAVSFGVNAAPAAHSAAPTHAKATVDHETTVTVGGAPMFSTKNIVENASHSKDHTMLVTAVKTADLIPTLSGPGPFTVFAPDNAAFSRIPKPTLDSLLVDPAGKPKLTKILTYHVVAGRMDSKDIAILIKKGKGSAKLKTVAGGFLTAKMDGTTLVLTDEEGGSARTTIPDIYQSNGVIHSIDTVLMPK